MKKLILLFFFLIFFLIFFLNSQGQTYHRFLENDLWYESINNFGHQNHRWYIKSTDTLINGLTYSIIKISDGNYNPYYIREDTILKRVYAIRNLSNPEYLLYDFGLNVGDSCLAYKLESIDSIQTNLGFRKKLNLLRDKGTLWQWGVSFIEGIGSPEDPFIITNYGGDPSYSLTCSYIGKTQYFYSTWGFDTCAASIYSNTITFSAIVSNPLIFPNPSIDKITISNYPFSGKEARVEIYNMMGELVSRELVAESSPYSQLPTEMNVSNLAAGVYIIQVVGEKMWRGKMIKE